MKKTVFCFIIFILTIGSTSGQPLLWNIEKLNRAKIENPGLTEQIVKDADKLLKKKIASVVEKEKPAPSGDKHDYISCAPYYWPDPANPTGPYIRRDGESNKAVLTPDKKNMGSLIYGVVQLSLAYQLTSDERYAAKAVDNLRIWFLNPATRMNPNLNFGQTIYGRLGGKGRGAGMIETYRFVELLDGVELLKKSPSLTEADLQKLKNWFYEYLQWMMTSEVGNQEYNAKNNHGTAFDVQAIRYALFVGKEDIARKNLNDFPARRLFAQIEPDGKQPAELVRTKALHYSVFNLIHILDICFIAKTMDVDLYNLKSEDGRSISKALEYVAQFAGKPKSAFPYQQISDWDGAQKKLFLQLYRADLLSQRPFFEIYYKEKLKDIKQNLIFN
ncbi:MAG: alginate lyase family protein [Paludibacter sp.]